MKVRGGEKEAYRRENKEYLMKIPKQRNKKLLPRREKE